MIYAAVLAGGLGTRMSSVIPKQFLPLGEYPIFIHSLVRLLNEEEIEQVWLGVYADWVDLAVEQIQKYIGDNPRLRITTGGVSREDTLMNIISGIEASSEITDDDIIITHDSVRPFATPRLIKDIIEKMKTCDACNTIIPVNDTVVQMIDGETIDNVPLRKTMFAGQSPQGFKINTLRRAFDSLSDEERLTLTETTKVCMLRNIPIHYVTGDFFNFKITTDYDYKVALSVLDFVNEKMTV